MKKAKAMKAIAEKPVEQTNKGGLAKQDDLAWLDEMGTWLEGKVTEKDLQDNPRLAHAWGYTPKMKDRRKA